MMPLLWSDKPVKPGTYFTRWRTSPKTLFTEEWSRDSLERYPAHANKQYAGPIPEDQLPRDPKPEEEPMPPCPGCGEPSGTPMATIDCWVLGCSGRLIVNWRKRRKYRPIYNWCCTDCWARFTLWDNLGPPHFLVDSDGMPRKVFLPVKEEAVK